MLVSTTRTEVGWCGGTDSIRTHSFKRDATIAGASFGNDGTSEGSTITKGVVGPSHCKIFAPLPTFSWISTFALCSSNFCVCIPCHRIVCIQGVVGLTKSVVGPSHYNKPLIISYKCNIKDTAGCEPLCFSKIFTSKAILMFQLQLFQKKLSHFE